MGNHDEKVITYLSQHKNILWSRILVLSGGLVGLVLTYNPSVPMYSFGNIARLIFFIIGFSFLFAMVIGLLNTDSGIQDILKKR
ncbi:MAG: hypothetical protein PHC64_04710 [Candidatus Gastranaerophilales bacterium]|nr:hypothetical protein [Candidatus Gastranaerophilales bacterium]